MTYDQKCYDLAEAFLLDEPQLSTSADRDALAQAIQSAIEDWIESAKQRRPIVG
jgi:hypothetical protein